MREHIKERVFALTARELGVAPHQLKEEALLVPEGWYQLALVCDASLIQDGFVFWRRPAQPCCLGDIIEAIYHHNTGHLAHA